MSTEPIIVKRKVKTVEEQIADMPRFNTADEAIATAFNELGLQPYYSDVYKHCRETDPQKIYDYVKGDFVQLLKTNGILK